jgi:3-deoxy-D-manno-octulosonic acid (KDO) 8-phosphate synthase
MLYSLVSLIRRFDGSGGFSKLSIGLARGGLRHGYIPGYFIEAHPAPSHARFRRSE